MPFASEEFMRGWNAARAEKLAHFRSSEELEAMAQEIGEKRRQARFREMEMEASAHPLAAEQFAEKIT